MLEIERRVVGDTRAEVGEEGDGTVTVRGHAVVWNAVSEDFGGWRERFAPGAFAGSLAGDIRLLVEHEGLPIARTTSGTLRLQEDQRGLFFEATLDKADPDVQRLLPKLRAGHASQMSFGFRKEPNGDYWKEDGEGGELRTVTRAKLFELSVVSFPAYVDTTVALRSRAEATRERPAEKDAGTPWNRIRAQQQQASI